MRRRSRLGQAPDPFNVSKATMRRERQGTWNKRSKYQIEGIRLTHSFAGVGSYCSELRFPLSESAALSGGVAKEAPEIAREASGSTFMTAFGLRLDVWPFASMSISVSTRCSSCFTRLQPSQLTVARPSYYRMQPKHLRAILRTSFPHRLVEYTFPL